MQLNTTESMVNPSAWCCALNFDQAQSTSTGYFQTFPWEPGNSLFRVHRDKSEFWCK